MKQKIYKVDAFANTVFSGNPAAVCPLDKWLPMETMQNIAMENNLSETAFYVKTGDSYHLRWFTPLVEVDLCGHATLATAHVLFNHENHDSDIIQFESRSGILKVDKKGDLLTLDFPADKPEEIEISKEIRAAFAEKPLKAYRGKSDVMLVYENEEQIINMDFDIKKIADIEARGVIITARGHVVDFVSRFFAPQSGVNEDPVTGSAHTLLTPYWSEVLGRKELNAVQLSARRGFLKCTDLGNRVKISGYAKTYLTGEIDI
jgi:PhzF family phenazine biosynthesis protein